MPKDTKKKSAVPANGQANAVDESCQSVLSPSELLLLKEEDNAPLASAPNVDEALPSAKAASATEQAALSHDEKEPSASVLSAVFGGAHEEDIILEVRAVDSSFVRGGVRFGRESVFIVVDDNHQHEQEIENAVYVSPSDAKRIYLETQKGSGLVLRNAQYADGLGALV